MAPKGKPGTKGQKQILQENAATLTFYRNMICIGAGFYFFIKYLLYPELSIADKVLIVFAAVVFFASYYFMYSMASPKYGSDGFLLDEGCDLNIEGGIAEHMKDLIILTTGCMVLSTVSTYFWLLWLLAPARAFHMLWRNILSPYIFQEAPGEGLEKSEKKLRKVERRRHR